jgi:hypothetical protein
MLLGLRLIQGQPPTSKATDRSVRPTLAANINGKGNTNPNVKGVGQECPTHTSLPCYLLDPKPLVVFLSGCQSSSDWILPQVFQFFFEAFLRAQDVVEGFFLPDWAAGAADSINASGRRVTLRADVPFSSFRITGNE